MPALYIFLLHHVFSYPSPFHHLFYYVLLCFIRFYYTFSAIKKQQKCTIRVHKKCTASKYYKTLIRVEDFPHPGYIITSQGFDLLLIFLRAEDGKKCLIRHLFKIFFAKDHIVGFFLLKNEINTGDLLAVLFCAKSHVGLSPRDSGGRFQMRVHDMMISPHFRSQDMVLSQLFVHEYPGAAARLPIDNLHILSL